MKLTRQRLKQLIIEAINEAKYYIGDDKGNVESAIDAYHGGLTKDAILKSISRRGSDEESNRRAQKAVDMMRSKDLATREQGRELARTLVDFGMIDDQILQDLKHSLSFTSDGSLEMTDIEKTALDHMPFDDKVAIDREYTEQPETLIDKDSLLTAMMRKSDGILSYFGFTFVEDMDSSFDYSDIGPRFRFQAEVLGCDVEDLAFVDNEEPKAEKTLLAIYDIIREKKAFRLHIPGDDGNFGENDLFEINGLRVLLTSHFKNYSTVTICGQENENI